MNQNELAPVANSPLLRHPGDKLEAYVTKTGKKVVKVKTGNGSKKQSMTVYPTGKAHLTQTIDLTKG